MLKSIFKIVLVSAVLFIALLYIFEKFLVYPGYWQREKPDSISFSSKLNAEIWQKEISTHQFVEAIFIPAQENPSGTVLFAHGNGELIDDWVENLSFYYEQLGLNLLLVEYRGYGRSAGTPNQEDITQDFTYFYDQLIREHGHQSKIIFHGRSLGGGVVANLLTKRPATHLILESTFTRLTDMARDLFLVPSFLVSNKYLTLETLATINLPSLVIHGTRDTIIPVSHGKTIFQSLTGKKHLYLTDSDHNDPPPYPRVYLEKIVELISE